MTAGRLQPFDVITHVLAERLRGCEASAELRATMRSQDIGWTRVVEHASGHLILPAFAAALRDLDLVVWLDEELGGFLEAVYAANVERNGDLRNELAAAVGVLNGVDIEPVLLKGAIRLLDGLYPDPGWRMLRDLDILIPEPRWQDALHALQGAGYALTCAADSAVGLRRPGGLAAVDVHKEIFSTSRQERLLRGREVVDGARPTVIGSAVVRVPSMLHQVVHLVGHGQISSYNYALGRVGLRDRLEAGALVRWGAEPVDWDAVLARFAAAGYRRPLLSFLLALRDGALVAVPPPGKIDALTMLQERRIAWQTRSRMLAHVGFWPIWALAMLRTQIEEREGGRPKFVRTLTRLVFERGAGQRMLRTFIYGAPRP
jgi:Uncharacterised nucleotidyltransferase